MHAFTSSVTGRFLTTLVLMSNLQHNSSEGGIATHWVQGIYQAWFKEWSCHAFSRILLAQPINNSEKDCVEENTAPAQSITKSCEGKSFNWRNRCPKKVSGLLFQQTTKNWRKTRLKRPILRKEKLCGKVHQLYLHVRCSNSLSFQ